MNSSFIKILDVEAKPDNIQLVELTRDSSLTGEVRVLLGEYGRYMYDELSFVAGKESFFKELETFPGAAYFPPSGKFMVATVNGEVAGCVGIRKFDEKSCEMKRMYTRPAYRGKGVGTLLCNYVIDWCRASTYNRILLDTNIEMNEAVFLYRKSGFKEIAPYCINENKHPLFMEYVV